MDRVDLPLLNGWTRRGWMMFSQISFGLACRHANCTKPGSAGLALCTVVAFASSTQDIVVDACELNRQTTEKNKALSRSAYQFSYRLALLTTIPLSSSCSAWAGACPTVSTRMYGRWNDRDLFAKDRSARCGDDEKARSAALDTARFLRRCCGPFIASSVHMAGSHLSCSGNQPYRLPDFIMGPSRSLLP